MKILLLVLPVLLVMGCNTSFDISPTMERFYNESVELPSRTVDSINKFDNKVNSFTIRYPEALDHYRYPQIKENVRVALVITVDTAWAGTDSEYYNFGSYKKSSLNDDIIIKKYIFAIINDKPVII